MTEENPIFDTSFKSSQTHDFHSTQTSFWISPETVTYAPATVHTDATTVPGGAEVCHTGGSNDCQRIVAKCPSAQPASASRR